LDAIEVAFLACHNRRVALRHWNGSFFRQSIPFERERYEMAGCNHATGRIILFGGLGLFSVGSVESLTVNQSDASTPGENYAANYRLSGNHLYHSHYPYPFPAAFRILCGVYPGDQAYDPNDGVSVIPMADLNRLTSLVV